MLHQPYPELQLECVTTLIDIGRRGAFRAEIKEAAKCAYDIEGAALKIFVGEPDDVIVGQAVTQVGAQLEQCSLEQLEECHATLDEMSSELSCATESFGAEAAEGIDPATLALFMQLAMKLIELFMNRKKNTA